MLTQRVTAALAAVLLLLGGTAAQAQTVLGNTVLQTDLGTSARTAILANGSSLAADQVVFFFDDQPEAALVTAVSGNRVTLQRAYGTTGGSHATGTLVLYGAASSFSTTDQTPGASCSGASVIPSVNLLTRRVFQCVGTTWTQVAWNLEAKTGQGAAVMSSSATIASPTITGATVSGATLTTATITSPTISSPTISGTIGGTVSASGLWTFTGSEVRAGANVGAKNGATVACVENGNGTMHRTVCTLTATPLTIADATVGAGVKIYDFPEGSITFLAAVGTVTETTTSTLASTLHSGSTYNWGIGTTTQANGTLATTEQDIIQTTNGTSSATINVAAAASTAIRSATTVAQFNGTATPVDAYFNVGIASGAAIDADATTTWTGTITITWLFNGDL